MNDNFVDEHRPGGGTDGGRMRRIRWWMGVATAVLAVGVPWLMVSSLPAGERTYAGIAGPTQLLVSIVVPCITVLLAREAGRPAASALLRAVGTAAGFGAAASAGSAVAATVGGGPWQHTAVVAIGGIAVQVGAGLVGFGLGLVFRSPLLACPATVVLPIGAWLALSAVPGAQAWLTPLGANQALLAGDAGALPRWLVMAAVWGGVLIALGARLSRRRVGAAG